MSEPTVPRSKVQVLIDALEIDAYCPCCTAMRVCADECSFRLDCPSEWSRMNHARKALIEFEEGTNVHS